MDDTVFNSILKQVQNGKALHDAISAALVDVSDFYDSLSQYPRRALALEQSLKIKAQFEVERIFAIADDDSRHPQHNKNRITVRQWYASKMLPKIFGDRLDVNVDGKIDLVQVLEDAKSRLRSIEPIEPIEHKDAEAIAPVYVDVKKLEDIFS